eukprot:403357170
MSRHPVKLSEILSLAEHSGKIIKQVHYSGNYQATAKENIGFDDLFTIADTTVQKTIESNLKYFYPYAKIIGEEDEVNLDKLKPTLMPDQINKALIPERLVVDSFRQRLEQLKSYSDTEHGNGYCHLEEEEALNINQEDLTFWIDPLDGTRAFKNGKTDSVTSIIGVSVKGKPKIGILHQPFYKTIHGIKESKTYLGSIETGVFYSDIKDYMDQRQLYEMKRSFHYLQPFQPHVFGKHKDYEVKVLCSVNRFEHTQNVLDHMKPLVSMRLGGAGQKAIVMLDEYADFFVHVVQGIKFWDMCASEALIRGRFGIITNKDRQPIVYEENLQDYTILNGIMMARSEAVYDLCMNRIEGVLKNMKITRGR